MKEREISDFDETIALHGIIGYAPAGVLPEVAVAADRIGVSCEEHLIAHIINEFDKTVQYEKNVER